MKPYSCLALETRLSQFIESLKGKTVIIYGGGKTGTRLCHAFSFFGIKLAAIWDQKAERIQPICGIEVAKPAFHGAAHGGATIVFVTMNAEKIRAQVSAELTKCGFHDIVDDLELMSAVCFLECQARAKNNQFIFDYKTCDMCPASKSRVSCCDIQEQHLSANVGNCCPPIHAAADKFVIPSMGILITNRCNLMCIGCNHLRDLHKPSDLLRIDTEILMADMQRILEAVDFINKVVVVGGEAFLHDDLHTIVQRMLALPKIGMVHIITNGTVMPKDEKLFKLFSDKRVLVEISGYGEHLPQKLRKNIELLISSFARHGISYNYLVTLEWQDFGDLRYRNYTEEQHRKVYETCCFISNDLFDGRLYKCSRSVFATRLGKIPDYTEDYVDVRITPGNQLRQKLIAFLENNKPRVCQHCNGTSESRIPAGVQKAKSLKDAA